MFIVSGSRLGGFEGTVLGRSQSPLPVPHLMQFFLELLFFSLCDLECVVSGLVFRRFLFWLRDWVFTPRFGFHHAWKPKPNTS